MACPLDQGLLFSNTDNEDKIFIYCVSCKYKSYVGTALYSKMTKEIENANRK